MKRWLKFAALPVLLALGYLAGSVVASPGQAGPGGDGDNGGRGSCLDAAHKVEDPGDMLTISAPAGRMVRQVAIKIGSDDQKGAGCLLYPPLTSGPCYTVSGLGTAVVRIRRSSKGSDCKEISHVEWTTTQGSVTTPTTTTPTNPNQSRTPTTDPKTSTTPPPK